MTKALFLQENQRPGEVYGGLILDPAGDYHLFVTLGDHPKLNWKAAIDFAKKAKLALPNRRELRLLWVNAKAHFKDDYYWSSEQYADNDACAWYQHFAYGNQYGNHKASELRVVLVRRVAI